MPLGVGVLVLSYLLYLARERLKNDERGVFLGSDKVDAHPQVQECSQYVEPPAEHARIGNEIHEVQGQ